ncbi:MAG: T9SS type A sorting domain-containing protein [Chitinophagales bacterium]
MKNSVTQFCLWLIAALISGPLLAQPAVNLDFAKAIVCKNSSKSVYPGRAIAQDDSGFVYVSLVIEDTTDVDPGSGVLNFTPQTGAYNTMAFARYSGDGELMWAKNIEVDVAGSISKIMVYQGSIYLFGQYRSHADFDPGAGTAYLTGNASINTPFVAKYTLNGDFIFAKNMATTTGDVYIYDVATYSFGYFVVVGAFSNSTDFDPSTNTYTLNPVQNGYYDGYVAEYDTNFTQATAYRLSGASGSTASDYIEEVEIDNNNNVYLAGYSGSGPLYTDFFNASVGQLTPSNTSGNAFILKYNDLFQRQWGYFFNSSDYTEVSDLLVSYSNVYALLRCDGGVVDFDPSANNASSNFNSNPGCALLKLDDNGVYGFHKVWQTTLANNYIDLNNLQLGSPGILVSGRYRGTVDLDPDVPQVNAAATDPSGNSSICMLLNYSGTLQLHKELTGNANTCEASVFSNQNNQYIYVTGTFSDTVNFNTATNPSLFIAGKSSQFSYNTYLAKYDFFDLAPDTISKNMLFSNVTDTTMKVSFTKGNGNKRIVIAREAAAVNAEPLDGIFYYSDTVFGMGTNFGGQYVVYSDTGSSFTVTGLTPNTVYHFAVYEFNGYSSQINYLTSAVLRGNQKTTLNGNTNTAVNNLNSGTSWNVYPNPVASTLIVERAESNSANAVLSVFDVSGKLMLQQELAATQRLQFDLSGFSAGIYLVNVKGENGIYQTKIIKM